MNAARRVFEELLEGAGVRLDGPEPWDMRVNDGRVFARALGGKNLGLGEAYMDGWWDCERLEEFFRRLLTAGVEERVRGSLRLLASLAPALLLNRQTRLRSKQVAERHYNLDNTLFLSFLDPLNQYSCGYFRNGCGLEEAQRAKLDLLFDKLELGPGDRLLDIGCGWGGLARYAAETRGCSVTAVNIAREQIAFAREHCAGLPVEVLERDWRDIPGRYPKIVSVGMFEHVGPRNHRAFLRAARRALADDGIFVLHTIGSNRSRASCDPWIDTYIFPNGQLPSVAQLGRALEGLFVMEDWHNLGPHYARTLLCWHENFERAWPRLAGRYDERFRRMWRYYLLSCAGAFQARDIQLWQVVLTPPGRSQPRCRPA